MKTAFSNYKLCCICNSNFYDTVVREIEDHEELYIKAGLANVSKRGDRRMEKFSICNKCNGNVEDAIISSRVDNKSVVELKEVVDEGAISFSPSVINLQFSDDRPIEENNISVMLPVSCKNSNKPNFASAFNNMDLRHLLYQNKNITRKEVSVIYENEMYKLERLIKQEKRFVGTW